MWRHLRVYRYSRSPWASALQTTLQGEQHGPARPHEGEPSPHEGAAWLRNAIVHHVKRASPYGKRRPWHTLSTMPASHAGHGWSDTSVGARTRRGLAMALQANLPDPVRVWGAAERGWGPRAPRHLTHAVGVFHTAFNLLTGLPTGSLDTPHSPFTWTRAPKPFCAPRPLRRILQWAPWYGNGSRNALNSRADGRRQGNVSPPAPPTVLCRRQEDVKSSHPLQCLVVSELGSRVPSRILSSAPQGED